ncbi:MAG: histidine kinase [Candidatus Peregrinibacteria bacterium GW2011_GWF2_33_10]|nr:MAG: histidine kinase [Candidatus Peregrinibacteria bacterium GW2011_GWF2_33_10]OGJ44655.1 MAG: hypothetical protein A2263_00905 [Candidatus Peregrinibacteria bacterium RIFOXYA2_FULL_33_21]OGJ50389.1 MAG: hypothetical protein A2307_05965 [Candidatus Peregrinibacteria bacterium RIFOXYB2_FULL_33_20]
MIYPFLAFSAIFNLITSVITGIFVYSKNKQNPINRTFAIFCLFVALWSLGYFFPFTPNNSELTLLSERLLHIGALFIGVAQFHFVCTIIGIAQEKKRLIWLGYIFNLATLPFVYTRWFIPRVVPKGPLTYYPDVGVVYHIWLFVWVAYIAYAMYLLYTYYKKSTGIRRYQLKLIFIGDTIAFVAGSTNYLLAYNIDIAPYATIFSSAHVIFLAYAVVKYRFLDLRLNLSKGVKRIISFILASLVFFGIVVYGWIIVNLRPALAGFIGLIFFALCQTALNQLLDSNSFYKFFHKTLNYHNFVDFKKIIDDFKNKVPFYTHLEEFEKQMLKTFCQNLRISAARIVVIRKDNKDKIYYKFRHLIRYFETHHDFLVTEEINLQQNNDEKKIIFLSELKQLGQVCFPLYQADRKLIGFFVLGRKPFDDPYSKEELSLLNTTARYIALSLSVILYNYELHIEIAEKTKNLREQNKEIKKLFKMQSDFIAVTAHEFRTPLSIALFQLEELLDESSAQFKQGDSIQTIKSSLENLKYLTQKLFDVQLYDLNKVEIRPITVDVVKFVNDIFLDFRNIMAEKQIIFKLFNHLKQTDHRIYMDELRMRQVLNNILSNAYKFVDNRGKIYIDLRKDAADIIISIADNGPGIADSEKQRVFEKFQTKKASMAMGIGLGLYISKKIVELHKGQIWVENADLGGAKFCIKLNLSSVK